MTSSQFFLFRFYYLPTQIKNADEKYFSSSAAAQHSISASQRSTSGSTSNLSRMFSYLIQQQQQQRSSSISRSPIPPIAPDPHAPE
jgi:hypothetical protein